MTTRLCEECDGHGWVAPLGYDDLDQPSAGALCEDCNGAGEVPLEPVALPALEDLDREPGT